MPGEAAQRVLGEFGRYERDFFLGAVIVVVVIAAIVFVRRRAGTD